MSPVALRDVGPSVDWEPPRGLEPPELPRQAPGPRPPRPDWHHRKAAEPVIAVTLGLTLGDLEVLREIGWGPDDLIRWMRQFGWGAAPASMATAIRCEIRSLWIVGAERWFARWEATRQRAEQRRATARARP